MEYNFKCKINLSYSCGNFNYNFSIVLHQLSLDMNKDPFLSGLAKSLFASLDYVVRTPSKESLFLTLEEPRKIAADNTFIFLF